MLNKKLTIPILFWTGISLLFILRFIFSISLESHPDESYYALYARHLNWGYVDHGPMVAWIIKLFTLFNESPLLIRGGGLLGFSALSIHLFFFGKRYFTLRFAFFLSSLFSFSMVFFTANLIMTPDMPLCLFSIWTIMAYFLAFFHKKNTFLLGGVCLGMAALSKISAAFLGFSLFLAPFLIPQLNSFKRNIHFYISFCIALIIFLPFILWNYTHDWIFFRYQGAHIQEAITFIESVSLWLGASILLGPLFTYFMFWKTFKSLLKQKQAFLSFFGLLCAVPFCYFFISSFKNKMELNWLLPVFFSLPFFSAYYLDLYWPKFKKIFYTQIIWNSTLILLIIFHLISGILPVPLINDSIRKSFYRYQGLIKELEIVLNKDPRFSDYPIVANNYQIPSLINQYLKPKSEALCLSINYHPTLYTHIYPNRLSYPNKQLLIQSGTKVSTDIKDKYHIKGPIYYFQTTINKQIIDDFTIWEIIQK